MLHARRRRLKATEELEASGVSLWTDSFEPSFRNKVRLAFQDAADHWSFADYARSAIMRDEGMLHLAGSADQVQDLLLYLHKCDDEMVPTVIEAMCSALIAQHLIRAHGNYAGSAVFEAAVKVALLEHRISFDIVDHQMIEFSSRELHVTVVEPALSLLGGAKEFANAEKAYQDALSEISANQASDAITDAGTALQETLTALGCDGNALGPLIRSAKASGLLAPHDGPMMEAIEKTLHWVSADRSTLGDAHTASTASVADAWLTVHIVGALILRLTQTGRRA